jgi:hypothetical protein
VKERMIDLNDEQWQGLHSGYRKPYDASKPLKKIEEHGASRAAWDELWENLHHQGQVGEASFAAIPMLAQLIKREPTRDWNVYALAGIIELSRNINDNPDVPAWLIEDYTAGLNTILEMGLNDLSVSVDVYTVRAILGFIASMKGIRDTARLLLELDESEIQEILSEYLN